MTQLLNGDFDHRLSKLVELSLSVGLVPKVEFVPVNELFEEKNAVAPRKTVRKVTRTIRQRPLSAAR